MSRKITLLLATTLILISCSKESQSDSPIVIRLENLTGKEISAVTFTQSQSNTRPQFEYQNVSINGYSEYVVQTEANFSQLILIEYADGSRITAEHPWHGNEQGRWKPDGGKYTYKMVALNGNPYSLFVQTHRD